MSDPKSLGQTLWSDVFKLPVQILALGLSIFGVILLFQQLNLPTLAVANGQGVTWLQIVVALAIFAVGIGVVAFLWWLSSRFFGLLGAVGENAEKIAQLKDLPMGLPEGTVRAVLALVVAVVGLPLLLFSNVVGDDKAIAGYINGIITGVFGFYFGTRTSGIPPAAMDKITNAQQSAIEQTKVAAQARQEANDARATANAAQQESAHMEDAMGFDSLLGKAQRQLVLAKTVLSILKTTGALPKELTDALPQDLDGIVAKAESTIGAVRGLSGKEATSDKIDDLKTIVDNLTGGGSPLSILLGKAGPLVANVVPALGPLGGIAMLLGIGVKLGSDQFKRWRARVLAAPLAQGLVEAGALTPQLARAALERTPGVSASFAGRAAAEVDAVLSNVLVADDAAGVLGAAYGPAGNIAAGLVGEDALGATVTALQQSLLALYGAGDISDDTVNKVRASFGNPASPGLAAAKPALDGVRAADVNALLNQVSGASLKPGVPVDQAAAFDMLVMLVDTARRENIDLAQAIAELRQ
ncbi:hypothetical protein [Niveibacterium sp. SC-1]|uniref:hypothetical protein n=1 Tax=Niveibacterium sp. SC-1 TaxID=3135646 RepID=UPI00311F0855